MTMRAKVSKRHHITIPAQARTAAGIRAGDYLIMEIHEGAIQLRLDPENTRMRLNEQRRSGFAYTGIDEYIARLITSQRDE